MNNWIIRIGDSSWISIPNDWVNDHPANPGFSIPNWRKFEWNKDLGIWRISNDEGWEYPKEYGSFYATLSNELKKSNGVTTKHKKPKILVKDPKDTYVLDLDWINEDIPEFDKQRNIINKFADEAQVKWQLLEEVGPGGGWPNIEVSGTGKNLIAFLTLTSNYWNGFNATPNEYFQDFAELGNLSFRPETVEDVINSDSTSIDEQRNKLLDDLNMAKTPEEKNTIKQKLKRLSRKNQHWLKTTVINLTK